MRSAPRFFSSELSRRERRVYGAVTLFAVLVFLALSWPVYTLFSGIRPLVLGMPLSLFYIVVVLIVSFLVLLGLYLWEDRRGVLERGRGGDRAAGASSGGAERRDPGPGETCRADAADPGGRGDTRGGA